MKTNDPPQKLVEHAPISALYAQKLVEHWVLRRNGSRDPDKMCS